MVVQVFFCIGSHLSTIVPTYIAETKRFFNLVIILFSYLRFLVLSCTCVFVIYMYVIYSICRFFLNDLEYK